METLELQEVKVNPLQEILDTLEYQKSIKQDLIIPSGFIKYDGITGLLNARDLGDFQMNKHAHTQMAERLGIPPTYYEKMKVNAPELLGTNINTWLSRKEKTSYLLRTYNYNDTEAQNICRAILSSKYNILDNYDVLLAALEAIKKTGINVQIEKATITNKRMYLHVVAPEIHREATELLDGYLANRVTAEVGKGIISGIVISNSEVGLGTFEISARAQILQCRNGLHDRSARYRKVHLGARMDDGIINWSQNTKNKNYELIMAQVGDAVKTYLSDEYLGQLTTSLSKHKNTPIVNPVGVIEKVSNELSIAESHKESILKYFLRDGDETAFGLMNAFTRESQHMDADSQFEIEAGVFNLLPKFVQMDTQLMSKN